MTGNPGKISIGPVSGGNVAIGSTVGRMTAGAAPEVETGDQPPATVAFDTVSSTTSVGEPGVVAKDAHRHQTMPRVFVSYTHDTPEHKDRVKVFCMLLTQHGVDVRVDYTSTDRRRDWYTWAIDNITSADYVIVIASPTYCVVGDGRAPADHNLGGQSEAALLRELLHGDRERWLPKLMPVLFPGHTPNDIPLFLQPRTADHYEIHEFTSRGVNDLLQHLFHFPLDAST